MRDRCPLCKRLKKRSTESNRRYWLLLHVIAEKLKPEGKQFSAESWHHYMKLRYLGADEVDMPNGKVANIPKSSADLDKDEFAAYMFSVESWASDHDVYLDEVAA